MSAINNISLYIPHVFPNFNKEYIANAFQNIGDIERIDFVGKEDRNGKQYNAVYIHFNSWYNNKSANQMQNEITDTGNSRLYYDNTWYWIVLPNTAKKHIPGDRKPRIDLGDSNVINLNTSEKEPVLTDEKPISIQKLDCRNIVSDDEMDEMEAQIDEAKMDEVEAIIDEIEAEIEADNQNLVYVDRRYIQTIEEENTWLRNELFQLRTALINADILYRAEAAKVRAFTNINMSQIAEENV
jgi:hypothetical protein